MALPIQDTLDSSIRDVMGLLQKGDKADVLLCAVERLPTNDKTAIEIGIESFFRVTSMVQNSDKSIRAHLLRAKSRITAGLSHAALQDLKAILQLDPDHCEARDLLSHFDGEAQIEAGNFLFRDLTLQLGTGKWDATRGKDVFNPKELDKWHAQRSAEILCRLNSDATYARQVRSLMILHQ
ncbi:hypothetical protein BC826DRAFT_1174199 [Russula brevipes]|nr:hypothetical protein BC826DRAFT_1174199 [Russula brevipes]